LSEFTLKNLEKLQLLRLSQSELCMGLSKLGYWSIFFQGPSQLKELNAFTVTSPLYKMECLALFQHLDLEGNMLSNFDEVETRIFPILQNLTSLSLSRNLFSVIVLGPNFQQYMHKNESVIDLFVNLFECSCQNLQHCFNCYTLTLLQYVNILSTLVAGKMKALP
jgi:Leucine-rich repeat (LRR) protein